MRDCRVWHGCIRGGWTLACDGINGDNVQDGGGRSVVMLVLVDII